VIDGAGEKGKNARNLGFDNGSYSMLPSFVSPEVKFPEKRPS